MRIAICDDEKPMLHLLDEKVRTVLAEDNENAEIRLFSSADALLREYEQRESPFDILFLDIKMEGVDGVSAAEQIRAKDALALIVFITSSAEYVFRGYEVRAFRYLMKTELEYGFSRVLRDTIAELRGREDKPFTFQFGQETISLDTRKIYYFESSKRVVRIVLSNSEYKTYAKLDDIENELTDMDFIRCHQSYLVNAGKIEKITGSSIQLKNGESVPVSKKYRQSVSEAYLWTMR